MQQFYELKEHQRLEAKLAAGGFPGSIWETYSAFANTLGGIILLGVEELPDKTLRPSRLPDAFDTARQLWQGLCDKNNVSVNLLKREDIKIMLSGDSIFISVYIPRAPLSKRPVFIGGDAKTGSYRRIGDGDCRLSPRTVERMLRSAKKASRKSGTVLRSLARKVR